MRNFHDWKVWYESQAEPADPIDGASLYIDHFATDDYQYLFRRAREMARLSKAHLDLKYSTREANGRSE